MKLAHASLQCLLVPLNLGFNPPASQLGGWGCNHQDLTYGTQPAANTGRPLVSAFSPPPLLPPNTELDNRMHHVIQKPL